MGHADKLRSTVAKQVPAGRVGDELGSLQRTAQQQERELHCNTARMAALQRNYDTLSRIRQADQKQVHSLKAQHESQQAESHELREIVREQTDRNAALEERAAAGEAARAEQLRLQSRVTGLERAQKEREIEAAAARRQSADVVESNRALKLSLEKMSRVQHEMLQRSRKAEEMTRQLTVEKDAAEKAHTNATSKVMVQDRQLQTFLEANEALENDLKSHHETMAFFRRRKEEAGVERQTVEAYYEARLEETQSQYSRLLADIDATKSAAKDEVFRTYSLGDNAAVLPKEGDPVPADPDGHADGPYKNNDHAEPAEPVAQ